MIYVGENGERERERETEEIYEFGSEFDKRCIVSEKFLIYFKLWRREEWKDISGNEIL